MGRGIFSALVAMVTGFEGREGIELECQKENWITILFSVSTCGQWGYFYVRENFLNMEPLASFSASCSSALKNVVREFFDKHLEPGPSSVFTPSPMALRIWHLERLPFILQSETSTWWWGRGREWGAVSQRVNSPCCDLFLQAKSIAI